MQITIINGGQDIKSIFEATREQLIADRNWREVDS